MDFNGLALLAQTLSGGDLLVAGILLLAWYIVKRLFDSRSSMSANKDRQLLYGFIDIQKETNARLMGFFKILTEGSSEECTKEQAKSVILHTMRVSQYEIREFCRGIIHSENMIKDSAKASVVDCITNHFENDVATLTLFSYKRSSLGSVIDISWREEVIATCIKIAVDNRSSEALDTFLQQAYDSFITKGCNALVANAQDSGQYESHFNRRATDR